MEKEDLTEKIIGCAMRVHRALGPGFLESVYQSALLVELRLAGLDVAAGVRIPVYYRGELVGDFIADTLVEKTIIIELKACQEIHPAHEAQLVNYLQATGLEIGLVLNFGAPSLEIKRKHRVFRPKSLPVNPANPDNPVKRSAFCAPGAKHSTSPIDRALSRGFSLLELMVAMAVMAILLVLLLNMVDSGTRLWRANENRADSCREARAALGVMSRDLQNALAATNSQFLLNAAAFPNLTNIGNLVSNTNQGAALFFLAALPAKAQDATSNKSDVCQVGYFMAFGKSSCASNSPVNTMNIYRYILSSDPTFSRLTAPPLFPSDLSTLDPQVELLARNVTRFTACAYTLTNNSLADFSASATTPLPDLVEISVSAINQEAGKKLGNSSSDFSAWTATNSAAYTAIVAPAEQTFTTRIKLNRLQ